MSIALEAERLQLARNSIRNTMMSWGIANSTDNLTVLAQKLAAYTPASGGDAYPTRIYIDTPPDTTAYDAGMALDLTGIVVKAEYSDGQIVDVSNSITSEPAEGATLTAADTTIKIMWTWTEIDHTFETTQALTIEASAFRIVVATPPTKTVYTEGDPLDLTGVVINMEEYNSHGAFSSEVVTPYCDFSPADGDPLTANDTTVNVSYDVLDSSYDPTGLNWATSTFEELLKGMRAHDKGLINIYDYINVGDQRTVSLSAMTNTGVGESHAVQNVTLVIVDKNVVDVKGGGKCHFVWQLKNGLGTATSERGYMNSSNTNVGGWASSARRTWCNNVFYNALPAGLKKMLKTASIKTSQGNRLTTFDTTEDKIFLPCAYNIVGAYTYALAGEDTTQWEWYQTQTNRIKRQGTDTGSTYSYWTRSPYTGNATQFDIIGTGGAASYANASTVYLIAPAGCI